MSEQPISDRPLYPPDPTMIPGCPYFEQPSEDETLAAMMTRIDDFKVAGWEQGQLLHLWAEQHGYNPEICAEVVRLYRNRTSAEAGELESLAASAIANESAYTAHPQARTPVRPSPTNDSSKYYEVAAYLNSLVQTVLPPDSGDLTDVWLDILREIMPIDKVTELLEGIKTNNPSIYETIITVLAENRRPITDAVPDYTPPAPSVNPIPLTVDPDSSGRTIPTTHESTSTGRSRPPHRMTDAPHPAVRELRKPTRESRSPRPSRAPSPAPSRSASPSKELVLVREKRRGSHTAMVMSRPSSPIPRSATTSRLSRHVSWAPSPASETVGKSRAKTFDPKDVPATTIETKRPERPPVSSSHTGHHRARSTGDHRSSASQSKDHTHLTQTITTKGKKRIEILF